MSGGNEEQMNVRRNHRLIGSMGGTEVEAL